MAFVDEDDVLANAHDRVHVVGVDDGGDAELLGDALPFTLATAAGVGFLFGFLAFSVFIRLESVNLFSIVFPAMVVIRLYMILFASRVWCIVNINYLDLRRCRIPLALAAFVRSPAGFPQVCLPL